MVMKFTLKNGDVIYAQSSIL